ncbi:peroxisome biogenesis factor 10 isoform X1 [Salvelinus namaycush]|uniref:RING-type E3 ubiquitin transferase n=1 Tax=Salvelinus namaycush TaxID=8040 RepID=A0A8U1ER69_SALNM|nr:peroxisome biogenesis factor 10 isoform X1 [Salvelinus namaycush]
MPLVGANQPQLIRSSQKDEYYQHCLRNNANEAFQTLAGSKRWLHWRKEIQLLSDLAYYGLTTFSGYQTLGEEYVSIIQVDPTLRRVPSRVRRGALVLLHSLFPYLLDKLLVCLENELEAGEDSQGGGIQRATVASPWSPGAWMRGWVRRALGLLTEPQRRACVPAVLALQQGLSILHRVHVALFYISGAFYHLGKRTAGVSYLRVRGVTGDDGDIRSSYRLLGMISLMQLALTLALQLNNLRQRQRARQEWRQHRNLPSRYNAVGHCFNNIINTDCLGHTENLLPYLSIYLSWSWGSIKPRIGVGLGGCVDGWAPREALPLNNIKMLMNLNVPDPLTYLNV